MKPNRERDLEILTAISEGSPLTQRALATRLGVALGLTNLYLKRLATTGLIKIVEFPRKPLARKRLRYLLTPKGLAQKARLTSEYITYSLNLYRRTRQTLRESLALLPKHGMKRVALYGTGDAAELAYLTLKEFALEPLGVFASTAGGEFLGLPVRPVAELVDQDFDAVIIGTFDRPEPHIAELMRQGFPRAKCVTLRRVLASANGAGA
ncbi:MAG: winged helix-turn-helix transcriptional regulator [Candidatus Rokuibacteriota bacterium]